MFTLINLWAVLAATVVTYLIGWAWYSPLLWQKPWVAARGGMDEHWEKNGRKEMPRVMAYGFFNTFLMCFAIAVFLVLTGATTLMESLQVALLACFGFVVTAKFNELLYTAHPPHWGRRAQTLFLIDTGYLVVLFVVAAKVIWYISA